MDFRLRSDIPGHNETSMDHNNQKAPSQAGRLVIGENVSLKGVISNCADLVVEGNADAEMLDGQKVVISKGGSYKGNLEAVEAEISGTFEGKLTVHKSLTLQSSAHIKGELFYGSIQVQPGARIEGSMTTIQAEEPKSEAEEDVERVVSPVLEKPQTQEDAFGMDDIISRINAEDDDSHNIRKIANG